MADSLFGHGHSDNVGSFRHLRIPQNIHLYAENLRNDNSAKYFTHYVLRNSAKYKYPTALAARVKRGIRMSEYSQRVKRALLMRNASSS